MSYINSSSLTRSVVVLTFIAILFLWFAVRPSLIRSECSKEATSLSSGRDVGTDFIQNQKIYDTAYSSWYGQCLNKNGL
jgi:hypothetical protein